MTLSDCGPENHEYQIDLSQSIVVQIWKKNHVSIPSHLQKKEWNSIAQISYTSSFHTGSLRHQDTEKIHA